MTAGNVNGLHPRVSTSTTFFSPFPLRHRRSVTAYDLPTRSHYVLIYDCYFISRADPWMIADGTKPCGKALLVLDLLFCAPLKG